LHPRHPHSSPTRRSSDLRLQTISADAAAWVRTVVRERCPQAQLCIDPFHVVQWATDALDKVRRAVWNDLRSSDQPGLAQSLKHRSEEHTSELQSPDHLVS